jgi:phosphate transport system substrate-binding protein
MKKALVIIAAVLLLAGMAQAETIKIGGSGSMIPLLTELGKAYMKKNPKDTVEVNQKSMGQPGGIAAVSAGAIDIAMSGMDLTAEQLKLPLLPLEIARVAGVVAVSNDVTVKSITSKQLCDIYSGKITNWKQLGGADAQINAITRPESDSTKVNFRKGFACMANLVEAPHIPNMPKAVDMVSALEIRKSAIGPVDSIALMNSGGKFKQIKIDGKGYEDLASGKWPFILHNNLVLGKNRGDGVKRFLNFIKSAEGQAIIKKDKAIPSQFKL